MISKIPFGTADEFNVIIEVPQGEAKKYAYDAEIEAVKLSRVLYDGLVFPFNYGFVAETESGDGRHLDAFILATHPLSRGTVVLCRAIGMLKMKDRGKQDNKIIAVPISENRMEGLNDITDWPEEEKEKIKDFYKIAAAQWDSTIELLGYENKDAAKKELLRTLEYN
ncbi:MAG: inorganic diphosphatase [Candidatus Doudnabacteria bacterium]|nr:inorganic diphosphatase [Candidatus Doudnabacteria bacterium]